MKCSREGEENPLARSGATDFRSAPIAAKTREPGDLPTVPGEKPIPGLMPAASTEVVMAEQKSFRLRPTAIPLLCGSVPQIGYHLP